MTTDLELLAKEATKVSPRKLHRDVILHSHPRFEDMMRRFTEQFSTVPCDCVFSFDLNRLPEPTDTAATGSQPEVPIHRDEPLLSLQVSRADRIFLGIDTSGEFPSVWKLVLWTLLKSRPQTKGSLVLLEDHHPDPALVDFLEDLAGECLLDFIQWRPGAA